LNEKKIIRLLNILLVGVAVALAVSIFQTRAVRGRAPEKTMQQPDRPESRKAAPRKSNKKDPYREIVQKDIFKVKKPAGRKTERSRQVPSGTDRPNLELRGTVIGENRESYAVLLDKRTREENVYGLNDYVQGARIVKILPDKITLNIRGRNEDLLMSLDGKPSRPLPSRARPPRQGKSQSGSGRARPAAVRDEVHR
jgi:type II secretion system protein C